MNQLMKIIPIHVYTINTDKLEKKIKLNTDKLEKIK
jgi:hypothetical protein